MIFTVKKLFIKDSVKLNGRHFDPNVRIMLDAARWTAPRTMDSAVWVTSANDSQHMPGSKHFSNEAFDIRTRNIVGDNKAELTQQWTNRIQAFLGEDYDVVSEGDHIHIEFDP